MKKFKSEKELLLKLKNDIITSNKSTIYFFVGHFPLVYKKQGAIEDFNIWGIFSKYSLELGCKLAKFAKEKNKKIKFIFFVDDHIYESYAPYRESSASRRRKQFYQKFSGNNSKLPEPYRTILTKYGFCEEDVLKQNHKKKQRENCLFFSEKILRSAKREIDNACAREYTEFIENPKYFDKTKIMLISFIPQKCKGHICDVALDQELTGLSASHVFMDTMIDAKTKKELYSSSKGVTYRKD